MQITRPTIDYDAAIREARFEALRRRVDPGDVFDRAMELLKGRINDELNPIATLLTDILEHPPYDQWALEALIQCLTQRQREEAGAALADLFGRAWLDVAAIEERRSPD
jgi:hypothetical protein